MKVNHNKYYYELLNHLCTCADNFPWILPIFQLLAQQSAIVKSYHLFKDTATSLIKQRRAETEPGRVSCQLIIHATCTVG